MENKVVSIIVPVFNASEFLQDCINSLRNQSYKKLQIILIDDGSVDESGDICDRNAEVDKRILVIHKKNGGVSEARNIGLENVKGEYVMFVDADDILHSSAITFMMSQILENKADMCICKRTHTFPMKEYTKIQGCKVIHEEKQIIMNVLKNWEPFCKLTSTKFVKDIKFPNYKIGEDLHFWTDLLCENALQCIAVLDMDLYFYRIHDGSASNRYVDIESMLRVHERCYLKLKNDCAYFADDIMYSGIVNCYKKMAVLQYTNKKELHEKIKNIYNPYMKRLIFSMNLKVDKKLKLVLIKWLPGFWTFLIRQCNNGR